VSDGEMCWDTWRSREECCKDGVAVEFGMF